MSDENQADQQGQQENTEEKKLTEDSVNELINAKLSEAEERYKKEISGLNRRNSELEKRLEEEQLKGKSEAEKIEIERQKAIEEATQAKTEAERYRVGLLREKLIHEAGLLPEDSQLITAPDEEGIRKQIEYLQKHDQLVTEKSIDNARKEWFPGNKPKGGTSEKDLTYDDLLKMSNEELEKLPQGFTEKIFGGK